MTYPPIEPTTYDLVVVGTGLPESTIASAAATAGKSLLHLDPNPFYGSHFSSLSLDDLTTFLASQSLCHDPAREKKQNGRNEEDKETAIIYGIAMADYDQENLEVCKEVLQTKDGLERLALYHQSVGRFTNAPGALIYPIYGQGELPQAFFRRAAVKGCIYVLRMPVLSMLINKSDRQYKGVRLASGQDIFSHQLLLEPSFVVSSPLGSLPPNFLQESPLQVSSGTVKGKIAKAICIASNSLKPEVLNILLIYPPRSLYPAQATSVRVLQIGSNMMACPAGMFLLYISAPCDNASEGKNLLHVTVNALFSCHNSGKLESSSLTQSENTEDLKPDLLWSAFYIQDLSAGSFDTVGRTSMPNGNLNYSQVLDETEKVCRAFSSSFH